MAFEADARRPDGDGGSGLGLGPRRRGETRAPPPAAAGATFRPTLCATARLPLQPQATTRLSKSPGQSMGSWELPGGGAVVVPLVVRQGVWSHKQSVREEVYMHRTERRLARERWANQAPEWVWMNARAMRVMTSVMKGTSTIFSINRRPIGYQP